MDKLFMGIGLLLFGVGSIGIGLNLIENFFKH